MKILNFGSLNVDYVYQVDHIVEKGETLASTARHIFAGGKGLNQSVAMGRAGAKVFHAGCIGEDGKFMLELMEKSDVDTSLVKVLSEIPSGHAVIQNEKHGDNCILLFGGANQAISEEQVRTTLDQFESGDLLVLQNEVNMLPLMMELAHAKGMKIALNPSPMDDSIMNLPLQFVDFLFVNEIEAAQISEIESENAEQLLNVLTKKFPDVQLILTMGEAGSWYAYHDQCIHQDIFPVKTVDTTAAGDTFSGYFLSSLANGNEIHEALKIASCASSITVSRIGAAPSIPTMKEVRDKL